MAVLQNYEARSWLKSWFAIFIHRVHWYYLESFLKLDLAGNNNNQCSSKLNFLFSQCCEYFLFIKFKLWLYSIKFLLCIVFTNKPCMKVNANFFCSFSPYSACFTYLCEANVDIKANFTKTSLSCVFY